jgi:hypothetical protein
MDIYSMIEAGGRVKFEVTGEDLCKFAEVLIEKAQEMKQREIDMIPKEETYLTRQEAAEKFGVCHTTLWAWDKSGYLKSVKIGKRAYYALSDIQNLMSNRDGKLPTPSWGKGKNDVAQTNNSND